MANTYAGGIFTVNTDTNIAGLIALKGSDPVITDSIAVGASTYATIPTLTIEQDLLTANLAVGYAAPTPASPNHGKLIVSDSVTITFNSNGRLSCSQYGIIIMNGTMQQIAVGTGAADQTVTVLRESTTSTVRNSSVSVDGRWWRRVPHIDGRVADCAITSNSTNVSVTIDGRRYLTRGDVISIIDRTTGTVLASNRYITGVAAAYFTISGASVTTTTNHSIYVIYSADDEVFELDELTGIITFGDGTASAWDNNGGKCPPSGSLIKQCGILIRSSTLTTVFISYDGFGEHSWSGVCFVNYRTSSQWMGAHFYNSISVNLTDCAFTFTYNLVTIYLGCYFSRVHQGTLARCLTQWITSYSFQFGASTNITMTDCAALGSENVGFLINAGSTNISMIRPYVCLCGQGNGIELSGGPKDVEIIDPEVSRSYGVGVYVAYAHNVLVSGGILRRNYAGGTAFYVCTDSTVVDTQVLDQGVNGLYSSSGSVIGYGCVRCILDGVIAESNYASSNYGVYASQINDDSNIIIGCSGVGFSGDLSIDACLEIPTFALNKYTVAGATPQYTHAALKPFSQYRTTDSLGRIVLYISKIADLPEGWFSSGGAVWPSTTDWMESDPAWCPGFTQFNTSTISEYVGLSDIIVQYSFSNDFGMTWGEWTEVTDSNIQGEVPSESGLFVKFRFRRTTLDYGDRYCYLSYIILTSAVGGYNPDFNYRQYIKTEAKSPVIGAR